MWLYVMNHGIAFGAGFYENEVVVPLWMGYRKNRVYLNPELMRRIDPGQKFWAYVSTVPLTLLTCSQFYYVGLKEAKSVEDRWLQVSASIALAERLFTFCFFIPNAVKLMKYPDEKAINGDIKPVESTIRWWVGLNYIRLLLSGSAWVTAMAAISSARQ